MAKILRCRHIGHDPDCQFAAHGDTEDQILQQLAEHASTVHGLSEVPDELVQSALANIQNTD